MSSTSPTDDAYWLRPCAQCKELTYNRVWCRDCANDRVVARSSCRACGAWIWRPKYGGPVRDQHTVGCALADDSSYGPRNEEEIVSVIAMGRVGLEDAPR